jgi:hypothetical protein
MIVFAIAWFTTGVFATLAVLVARKLGQQIVADRQEYETEMDGYWRTGEQHMRRPR